jgi:hypothetical protein
MNKLIAVLLMCVISSFGQSLSYIPDHCKTGDVTDSYDGHWMMCTAPDRWKKFSMGNGDDIPTSWWGGRENQPYPDCRLTFKDDNHNWHCPWESASGRVVACEPCRKTSKDCSKWFSECESLVEIMKHHITAEPTRIKVNTPTDHTPDGDLRCPDEFYLHWYTAEHTFHLPICIKAGVPAAKTKGESDADQEGT